MALHTYTRMNTHTQRKREKSGGGVKKQIFKKLVITDYFKIVNKFSNIAAYKLQYLILFYGLN